MSIEFVYDGRSPFANVDIDQDLEVSASCVIEVRDEPDLEIDVDIALRFDERIGRSRAQSVSVMQREDGPEVTSRALRSVRVQDYIQQNDALIVYKGRDIDAYADRYAEVDAQGRDYRELNSLANLVNRAKTSSNWEERKLVWVFRVYRWAQIIGKDDPAKQVERLLDLSPRTASRWISRAREQGYNI